MGYSAALVGAGKKRYIVSSKSFRFIETLLIFYVTFCFSPEFRFARRGKQKK
jgi:hypothetical protein